MDSLATAPFVSRWTFRMGLAQDGVLEVLGRRGFRLLSVGLYTL